MRAVVNGDLVRIAFRVALPQRNAGVGAVFAQDVVGHVDEAQLVHVAVVVADDALERVHAGFVRGHAVAHVLDDGVRACDFDVFFAAAGRAGRAHVLIGVAAGADDGRIADSVREV